MKLNKYLDFISENAKSGKMMIFYSDSLRELFKNIADGDGAAKNVARVLLSVEDSDDSKDTYTLIDKTEKNDMISYVQTSRFYREYPTVGLSGEPLTNLEKQRGPFIKNSKFWTTGRTPSYGIGRWVRHIFNDVRETPISNGDLENFVNAYKSTYDKISKGSEKFVLVKGEDIRYWYLEDRYEEVRGHLGNSCMRKAHCQEFLDIYVQNPESCSLVILKSEDPEKIIGRALVWTLTDGRRFMDRIYTIVDSDRARFQSYAKEHDILTNFSTDYKVKIKEGRYNKYPYMDTFLFLDYEEGILYSSEDMSKDWRLKLQETDGTASDNSGRVWCEYHGEYIDEDDARYCEDVDGYVHYESAVWLEYLSIYVSDRTDTVYSEYHDQAYYSEDTVYSECMGDNLYLKSGDVIKFRTDGATGTDYCAKDENQYYISIGSEHYSRREYIRDPYTGEYHFKDEMLENGEKFGKSLEKKLEKDLEVKEKYTKDGKFDLEKYNSDLREMLVEYVPTEDFIEEISSVVRKFTQKKPASYFLPGLYTWILRDQNNGAIDASYFTMAGLDGYKNLFYSILEEMPEGLLETSKEVIKEYYHDVFISYWKPKGMFRIFESIDKSKFPLEIYKRIFFLDI